MEIPKTTTPVTCPHCNYTTSYPVSLRELAERKKLICEKCGREIAIDRGVFGKTGATPEQVPLWKMVKAATAGGGLISLRCPSCNATSPDKMTIHELAQKERIVCTSCGREIPIKREDIRRVEEVLERLGVPSGGQEPGTVRVPDRPPTIEPRRGCLGVMLLFALSAGICLVHALT